MLKLSESLTVHNIKDIQEKILSNLQESSENKLEFDASLLKDIDAAGIQLLLATYKTCEERKIKFDLINLNNISKKLLELAGVDYIIQKEVENNV